MPDALLATGFLIAAAVSLGASWVLVTRLERVGARVGLSEGLLGMIAALAADSPEITTAVTALLGKKTSIGAGVVVGSNVFNVAALLGLAAIVAGRIGLHRRVILLEGAVAVWIAVVCTAAVGAWLSPALGLIAALAVFTPYVVLLAIPFDVLQRLGLPPRWTRWLRSAVVEEEQELVVAIHPSRGGARDGAMAAVAIIVVILASVAMEQSASQLGARHGVPEIVIGALVLAAVTSLPNAVAGIYLAAQGRGAATLSTAMNSNALNVMAGLLIPATLLGISGTPTGEAMLVTGSYLVITVVALAGAYIGVGLRRGLGALIVCIYVVFVIALLTSAG